MNKEDIIKIFKNTDSTVLSFPERGNEFGDNHYRGNCSAFVQGYLCWKYKVDYLSELFAGSGSGSDICRALGIRYFGMDLNPNPLRDDIIPYNAIVDDVPDEVRFSDMCFMHPPYSECINVKYAGYQWADDNGECAQYDLSQMPWDKFMEELNKIVVKFYAAMSKGSYMAILCGDVRRDGVFHSMQTELVKVGEIVQLFTKLQFNYSSKGRTYKNYNFAPIVHENILLFKKPSDLSIDFMLPIKRSIDIRDSSDATWTDVVSAVLSSLGGKASLSEIYESISQFRKCQNNNHWKAKVRQTLQIHSCFLRVSEGVWQMAA